MIYLPNISYKFHLLVKFAFFNKIEWSKKKKSLAL